MSLLTEKLGLEVQEAELETQKALGRLPPALRWLLIIVVLATIPAYFLAKGISHGIWSARYSQGALTAKPSFQNPAAPKISPVSVTTLGPGQYAAAVQVSNQNLDLSLNNVSYEFDFYDAQKQEVHNYQGTMFLLPNQTEYLTVPTFTSTNPVVYTNFQLQPTLPWQKRLQIPTVNLLASLPTTSNQASPPAFVVSGTVYNDSPYTLATVNTTFILFDTADKIIGVSQRQDFTFAPYERRAYQQIWPNLSVPNLGSVSVTADTDTLNPQNLSIPETSPSPASNLSRPSAGQQ